MEGDPSLSPVSRNTHPGVPGRPQEAVLGNIWRGEGREGRWGQGGGGGRLHLGKKKNPHKTGEFQPIISPAADAH